MNERPRRTARTAGAVIVSVAPIAVCGAVAGSMVLAGDERMLQISAALPGVVAMSGLAVSALTGAAFGLAALRRHRRHRVAAERAAGEAAGAERERAQHRHFLARLDHELKNPIMAIRASAAASAQDSPEWRTVDAQAAKLSTLVRDLRKLAELDTRPLEWESVDLEQLLQESIGALPPAVAARFSLSVTRVPWAVPPARADLDLLSLAIDNVLGNAAKYSDGGAEVRLREEGGRAVIEVADSGRGIPAEDLPQVFDELARASNARDVAGSGLGLTLVATVMHRHGGDVSIRSLAQAGTVVTLRLPVSR